MLRQRAWTACGGQRVLSRAVTLDLAGVAGVRYLLTRCQTSCCSSTGFPPTVEGPVKVQVLPLSVMVSVLVKE